MSRLNPVDDQGLQRLLGGKNLANLRRRLRRRFARTEQPPDGFTLTPLARDERDALAGLLGRTRSHASSMRLSHSELDHALQRADLAPDLRTALEALDGPIVDHQARRERERRTWSEVFADPAAEALAGALEDGEFQRLVKRLARSDPDRARQLLTDAERVLAQLPAPGTSRSALAARTLGDAHGLDQGRPVTTLLRRMLDPAGELPRMRDVWATRGVLVSELAKPVAVLNLSAIGHGPADASLRIAGEAGEPVHLSLRALLQHPPEWRCSQRIRVCENPDVLVAAANALGADCPPLVCLDGQLSAAPRTLLDQLQAADCRFHYHGDFDWPGLRIANGIFARYTATPWRYSAADYQPTAGPALHGEAVEAGWDAALTDRMQRIGRALHEEAQLPELLADLDSRDT